jgi:CRP/FNR family cyclic AMP-dependent transcriptional regulator
MTNTQIGRGIDLDVIRDVLKDVEPPQDYPRGTDLFPQGGPSRSVFVIAKGIIKLVRSCPDGRVVVIGLRSSGWILGAGAALAERPFALTATTVTRCQAYRLQTAAFQELVRSNRAVSWYLHRMHVEEISRHVSRLADLCCLSARARLEAFFDELGNEFLPDGHEELEIPLRDWEIAQLVSVTPPYLSRLMQELIHEGRLHREGGKLLLPRAGNGANGRA